ncbi:beta-ketoacyl-ACP synthase III [Streptomyces sp. SP18CS02]|uniref:beta-ketoacyl-ACP synthase III n=1 Tax=Streptomyces sp. SP18CS02 TaxID=3002531 RepID=UPI002E775DE2|nr:beta-ketoacyl-ACP synthase III [Streptomyces sp. SP18CS02]MEE1753788.1 ketoacyl-ACP synthase III [Streptomyces sp. SP18CS02]
MEIKSSSTKNRYARPLGIGAYRPARIVGNAEICELIDSNPEWIEARSGIATRRFAQDESIASMGARAAEKALSAAGLTPSDVSCVILATMSYLHQAPPAAAACAAELGATGAAAFDLGAACAGFAHALSVANSLVVTGEADHVVVIGAERMSDIVDPRDRSTAFLFGDGAGAMVIGPAAEPGFGPAVWGTDTTHLRAIEQSRSFAELKDPGAEGWPYLEMAGQEVFRWAIGKVAPVALKAVEAAGVTLEDLDAFVPHQANMRITDAVVKGMGLPASVEVARTVRDDGNTSAASIPLALEALVAAGRVRPGGLVLTAGFGSGLSYCAQVVTLP